MKGFKEKKIRKCQNHKFAQLGDVCKRKEIGRMFIEKNVYGGRTVGFGK